MPRRLVFAATLALSSFVYAAADDDRERVVYKPVHVVELKIEGAAEKAMLEYQRWLTEPAGSVPLSQLTPAQQQKRVTS